MSLRLKAPVVPKTASFTADLNAFPSGTRYTNAGAAGAIVCTLPTPATGIGSWNGHTVELHGMADQSITLATAAGKTVTFNNAAATSVAASTAGQKIGALIRAVWNATSGKWMVSGLAVGHTYTVA